MSLYTQTKQSTQKKSPIDIILHLSLLPPSQRMQLGIILTSLQENLHVASLLGFTSPLDWEPEPETSDPSTLTLAPSQDMHLAEVLMKTLLRNLGYHTVSLYTCFQF